MRSAESTVLTPPAALKGTMTSRPADAWESRVRALISDLTGIIPAGQQFLFVDGEAIRTALLGFAAIPFPERDGAWSGPPADDAAAAEELARQRRGGASFIVFAWPAFWWLDYYVKLHRILRWGFPCILQNERVIVFDLRICGPFRSAARRVATGLPRISAIDLRYGGIPQVVDGIRWWLVMSRIAWTGTGSMARHLCELIESTESSGLPRVKLADVVERLRQQRGEGSPDRVFVHPLLRGCGSGGAAEIAALAAIAAAKRAAQILEFGTCDGAGTWHMWANSDRSARITTLDLPPQTKVEGSTDLGLQGIAQRPLLPVDSRVRLVEIDSRAWQPDVSGVDLCFIDAGHSYECVKNDSEKALPLMSAGGVIIWHDSTWRRDGYGVNQYLRDKRQQGLDVRQLVIGDFDFCCMAILIT